MGLSRVMPNVRTCGVWKTNGRGGNHFMPASKKWRAERPARPALSRADVNLLNSGEEVLPNADDGIVNSPITWLTTRPNFLESGNDT